jgi:hypothetical protein
VFAKRLVLRGENMGISLRKELVSVQEEFDSLEYRITAACIRKRNKHVRDRIATDFKVGMQESEEDTNDDDDSHQSGVFVQAPKALTCDRAQSFCVSAKAYQKLILNEKPPLGFANVEDSNIPQVIKYCNDFTLGAQEKLADKFLKDTQSLLNRMTRWADNTSADVQITRGQRQKVEAELEKQLLVLDDVSTIEHFIRVCI